jgi:hypothetical protein
MYPSKKSGSLQEKRNSKGISLEFVESLGKTLLGIDRLTLRCSEGSELLQTALCRIVFGSEKSFLFFDNNFTVFENRRS